MKTKTTKRITLFTLVVLMIGSMFLASLQNALGSDEQNTTMTNDLQSNTTPTIDYEFGDRYGIKSTGQIIEIWSYDAEGDDLNAEISIREWGESDIFTSMENERIDGNYYSHTYQTAYTQADNGLYIMNFMVSDGEFFNHYVLYLDVHIGEKPTEIREQIIPPTTEYPVINVDYTGDGTTEVSGELIVEADHSSKKIALDPSETYGVPAYVGTHLYNFTAIVSQKGDDLITNLDYEVTIEEAEAQTCDLIEELKDYLLNQVPITAWKNEDGTTKNQENSRNTMINKLDDCIELCEAENYEELKDKIYHDIYPKLTGMKIMPKIKPFENPWIVDEGYQEQLVDKLDAIIESIELNDPPIITVDVGGVWEENYIVEIIYQDDDGLGSFYLYLDGVLQSSGNFEGVTVGYDSYDEDFGQVIGQHTLLYIVEDIYGAESSISFTTTYPPPNEPPIALLEVNSIPNPEVISIQAGDTLFLHGGNSDDPDGYIVEHRFSFDDGTPDILDQDAQKTYNTVGTYLITLTVKDNDGATDTETLIVNVFPRGSI